MTAKAREASQKATWDEIKGTALRAFAWAEAHPDDPESIDAIVWTVHGLANGYYPEYADEIRKAFTLLTDRAIANEKVAPVCYYAEGVSVHCAEARRFLETALATSPSRVVRAAACLALARHERCSPSSPPASATRSRRGRSRSDGRASTGSSRSSRTSTARRPSARRGAITTASSRSSAT